MAEGLALQLWARNVAQGAVAKQRYGGPLSERQSSGAVWEGITAVSDRVELALGGVVVDVYSERCHLHHRHDEALPRRSASSSFGACAGGLLLFLRLSSRLVGQRRSDRGKGAVRYSAGWRECVGAFKSQTVEEFDALRCAQARLRLDCVRVPSVGRLPQRGVFEPPETP